MTLMSRAAMPRRARITPGGLVYHTLNRANGRNELFSKPEDYGEWLLSDWSLPHAGRRD